MGAGEAGEEESKSAGAWSRGPCTQQQLQEGGEDVESLSGPDRTTLLETVLLTCFHKLLAQSFRSIP